MDILAHALWAGAGVALLARRRALPRRMAVATVAMAAIPDVMQMLPLLVWWLLGTGTYEAVQAFAAALPGQEPLLPPLVLSLSHHLHCVLHSGVVAAVVSVLVWRWAPQLGVALAGWWSHILIDVFTHSADYYASPVFYPLTQRGFDGLAWNTPWFMVANYTALALVTLALVLTRPNHPP